MVRITLLLCLIIALGGCSSFSVKRDYEPKFDFTKLKTYSLREGLGTSIDKDTLLGQRVTEAVHLQLQRKGFRQVAKEQADFVIGIEYWEREYVEPGRVSLGIGMGSGGYNRPYSGWGLGYGIPRVTEQDTLAIRIYDASTNKEIWQGVASGSLDRKKPAQTSEQIHKAVAEIFEKFPPIPKK